MEKIKLKIEKLKMLSDSVTPVGLYLKLRDKFPHSFLLESSDYHVNSDNFSFLCIEPVSSFVLHKEKVVEEFFSKVEVKEIQKREDVLDLFRQYIGRFETDEQLPNNGFFGYTGFDAVRYFDTMKMSIKGDHDIPEMYYALFRFIIQIDHFKNEMTIIENRLEHQSSALHTIEALILNNTHPAYDFRLVGETSSPVEDQQFMEWVQRGKKHCMLGDVFQIVLSKPFVQSFEGDDFNVYRALRSINPSPYLFYFDFNNFKIFGSSPEAQLKISNNKAIINPIAGTFRRTGNDEEDRVLAESLKEDPKENAEHTMLVDLARNDLSKYGRDVKVNVYKEVQFFSHVIHLVSEVEATLTNQDDAMKLYAATFPAGTLSGAPKYKALELINEIETQNRGFYGGAIGMIGFHGNVNQAIAIRSFCSRNNVLYFQAGAGVVADSVPQNELQEVKNKLAALNKALSLAEKIK
ncbi:MAG TPA: anthranilate synthase component I family protein [Saprospiraceae bacterium]|jgi:anthranilate synthase component 1|nr:anthranilate synthase component I family protein [Saprospiraceae bacterium]WKZ62391.1 MAG: anthranilate synthase component I family protein [Saprospiraceae bacterium]HMY84255.1 anthranilate synthase component I family protein [Saprospiraceae bacterium]HNA76461.1 anthranilate synthase component I family protein [Saprospiraceae bacterium]HNB62650.1 anthranilate synthase component I family protein [Saprospiraceae bacterium]